MPVRRCAPVVRATFPAIITKLEPQ
jgi:hypothetical protein